MISCGDRVEVYGYGVLVGHVFSLGHTLGGRRRWRGGFKFKLCNNKRRILCPEWSLPKVRSSSLHYLDIPHRLVDSNTHTQTHSTRNNG